MPELPEVESVRRTLLPHLQGRRISGVTLYKPGQIRYPEPEAFVAQISGAEITGISRRGKYLLLELDGRRQLIAHLRMSGRLYISDPASPLAKHTHVVYDLDDGRQLRYTDMRTFGGFHLLGPAGEGAPEGLLRLGPEPMDPACSAEYLHQAMASRRGKVKALLLDQHLLSGLGNIYADETLFLSGIHPERPGASLSLADCERLRQALLDVLGRAIAKRGTTFSLYVDGQGRAGDFYEDLQVYGQDGTPCRTCGTIIRKIRVGGRGTHFCPHCQT